MSNARSPVTRRCRFDVGNTRFYYQAATSTLFIGTKDLGAAPQADPNLTGFRIMMTMN